MNTPSGDGAWLVKNSQGESYEVANRNGEWVLTNGYFWMSYYEPSLGDIMAVEMGSTDDYQNLYTHSGEELTTYSTYQNCGSGNHYFASVFTANAYDDDNGRENISGVMANLGTDYEVYVYLNPVYEDGKLSGSVSCDSDGNPIPVAKGTLDHGGVNTIDFSDNAVTVDNGQKFMIVIYTQNADALSCTMDTQQVGECYVGADMNNMVDTMQARIDAGYTDATTASSPYIRVFTNPEEGTTIKTTSIRFKNATVSLNEGGTYQTSVIYEPNNATYQSCGYRSSDDSVATVDGNGLITAKGYGTAVITATSYDGQSTATCTVNVNCTGYTLTTEDLNKGDSSSVKVVYNENYSGLTNADLTWSSSNTDVATVDSEGNITAIGNGSATIRASLSKFVTSTLTASCKVTVTTKATGISIPQTEYKVTVGETVNLGASVLPLDTTNPVLTYTVLTSTDDTFTVDANGLVKTSGENAGSIKIRIQTTDGSDLYKDVKVSFSKSVTTMTSDSYNVSIVKGQQAEVTFTALYSNGNLVNENLFIATSSNPSVVRVDEIFSVYADGVIYKSGNEGLRMTALSEGTSIVTVKVNDGLAKSVKWIVTVTGNGSTSTDPGNGESGNTDDTGNTEDTGNTTDDPDTPASSTVTEFSVKYKNVHYEYDGKDVIAWDSDNKKSITIPKTITYKGKSYAVTKIAADCFAGKKKLKSITIKANITSIGTRAFEDCTALKKITIPNSVKTIGKSAFEGCKKLTTVTIGKNVKSIGSKAFYNCKSLKKITFKGTKLKSVGKNAFKKIKKTATIKVPKSKLKAYKKILKGKCQSGVKINK